MSERGGTADRQRWTGLRSGQPAGLVRMVLADVDGVITGGEGQPADLAVLAKLEALNRASLDDPSVPAITLCTGRPSAYVELTALTCGVYLPCIFEHGAGLCDARGFRYAFHPALGDDFRERLAAIRSALEPSLLRPGRAFVQPGKEATMTLYPLGDTPLDSVLDAASEALGRTDERFTVERNVRGVEVRREGIDKGAGARWLADELELDLQDVAGVGDSDPDLAFLCLMGHAAAPANASPAVREAVDQVAEASFGEGLVQIIDALTRDNAARLHRPAAP